MMDHPRDTMKGCLQHCDARACVKKKRAVCGTNDRVNSSIGWVCRFFFMQRSCGQLPRRTLKRAQTQGHVVFFVGHTIAVVVSSPIFDIGGLVCCCQVSSSHSLIANE